MWRCCNNGNSQLHKKDMPKYSSVLFQKFAQTESSTTTWVYILKLSLNNLVQIAAITNKDYTCTTVYSGVVRCKKLGNSHFYTMSWRTDVVHIDTVCVIISAGLVQCAVHAVVRPMVGLSLVYCTYQQKIKIKLKMLMHVSEAMRAETKKTETFFLGGA